MTAQPTSPHLVSDSWIAFWEHAGLEAVEQDLIQNDGKTLCGGSGSVRRLAWSWLRTRRAAILRQVFLCSFATGSGRETRLDITAIIRGI